MRAANRQREHLGSRLFGWPEAELLQARAHVLNVEVAIHPCRHRGRGVPEDALHHRQGHPRLEQERGRGVAQVVELEYLAETAGGALIGPASGMGINTSSSGSSLLPRAMEVRGLTPDGTYLWQWAGREGVAGTVGTDGSWWMASGGHLFALYSDNLE